MTSVNPSWKEFVKFTHVGGILPGCIVGAGVSTIAMIMGGTGTLGGIVGISLGGPLGAFAGGLIGALVGGVVGGIVMGLIWCGKRLLNRNNRPPPIPPPNGDADNRIIALPVPGVPNDDEKESDGTEGAIEPYNVRIIRRPFRGESNGGGENVHSLVESQSTEEVHVDVVEVSFEHFEPGRLS